jgi:hypothetical protein
MKVDTWVCDDYGFEPLHITGIDGSDHDYIMLAQRETGFVRFFGRKLDQVIAELQKIKEVEQKGEK